MTRSLRATLMWIGVPAALAAAVILAIALSSFGSLDNSARKALVAKDVVADVLPPPMYLIEARLVLSQAVEQTLEAKQAIQRYDQLVAEYRGRVAYWQAHPPYGLERQLLGVQHEQGERFMRLGRTAVLDRLALGDAAGAQRGLREADAAYLQHRQGVDDTVKAGSAFAEASIGDFESTTRRGYWLMPAMAAALLAVAAAIGWWTYRGLIDAVSQCTAVARRVAEGDLTQGAHSERGDEIGELIRSLEEMRLNLSRIVGEVRDGATSIAQATTQIAQGNHDLSARTESQASSLEQTAAAVEQMSGAMRSSADTARQADALATDASRVAEDGNHAVGEVMSTMGDIQRSSQRIADIIGVIDSIAFQTNILALNAAVEAARAGDQGRGFAVVAGEVRNLAQRSAVAAREIKDLITSSVSQVEAGGDRVDNAGRTIGSVVSQVRKVTSLIGEITTSSSQQSSAFVQINAALGHIDAATQQNSALVEENAAAAESLQTQAARLTRAVDTFRLAGAA